MVIDKEHEIINEQKLVALRKSFEEKDTDQNNVNSKKISKRVLLKSLLPVLIAGGCVVSAQSPLKRPIPEILPQVYASSSSPSVPADYIIFKSASTYYALNCATGNLDYESSTADVVINGAFGKLPAGGIVHLAGNTIFNLSNAILFDYGIGYKSGQYILEGDGYSSVIQQNTSGKYAVEFENGSSIVLRNFLTTIGASAAGAWFGSNGGATNEYCCADSLFENCQVQGASSGSYLYPIRLINPDNILMNKVYVSAGPASGGALMALINNSASINYGNSQFNEIGLAPMSSTPSGVDGLYIAGTSGQKTSIGLNSFVNCFLYNYSNNHTGSNGVHLDLGASSNFFYGLDCERFGTAFYVNGTSSQPTQGALVSGGYLAGITTAIQTTANTFGISCRDLTCGLPTSGVIINEGGALTASAGYNSYNNIQLYNNTATITVGSGIFTGFGGGPAFFNNQGVSTQNGNGSTKTFTINHNLATLTSGSPRYSMVNVNGNLGPYTWTISGKQISVSFVTAPPKGTANVIMNWSAGI